MLIKNTLLFKWTVCSFTEIGYVVGNEQAGSMITKNTQISFNTEGQTKSGKR